ncbi:MAG: isochorismatase family protein [Bacteroidetes bacterium]|nr:isochorismatase family protein [Bacteroidota bacterium]
MKHTYLLIISCILIFNSSFGQTDDNLNNKFVIVLDVQEDYTKDMNPDSMVHSFISSINNVIENTPKENVIYVVSLHKALFVSFKSIYVDTIVSLKMDPNLILVNDNIFVKEEGNAFSVVELKEYLKNNDAKDIIVTGLLAEKCVYGTLMGGIDLGYHMCVVPEAIIGKSAKSKLKTLSKLAKKGVTVLPLNDYYNLKK